jgi:hypothetical protein
MTQRRKTSPTPAAKAAAGPAALTSAPSAPQAKPAPLLAVRAAPAALAGDDEALDTSDLGERIFLRPDGYYWQAIDGKQDVGPFDTHAEAMADMDSGEAGGWTPGETLAEAESELGLADWIDADSGGLAEGQSRTHIERE